MEKNVLVYNVLMWKKTSRKRRGRKKSTNHFGSVRTARFGQRPPVRSDTVLPRGAWGWRRPWSPAPWLGFVWYLWQPRRNQPSSSLPRQGGIAGGGHLHPMPLAPRQGARTPPATPVHSRSEGSRAVCELGAPELTCGAAPGLASDLGWGWGWDWDGDGDWGGDGMGWVGMGMG